MGLPDKTDPSQKLQSELERPVCFMLRTPALPAEQFSLWNDSIRSDSEAFPIESRESWESAVTLLRRDLVELSKDRNFSQSIFVASPSLHASIEHWRVDPDSKKGLQTERALVRYLSRMSCRCTPFGLFSGCSSSRIPAASSTSETTILNLGAAESYRSRTRLDFNYLFSLTAALRKEIQISSRLVYRPNSSLHKLVDKWHYVEARSTGSSVTHHLVRIYSDATLEAVLDLASQGLTQKQLVSVVESCVTDQTYSLEEIEGYVQELVSTEVLVSDLYPVVSGISPLDDIIEQIAPFAPESTLSILTQVRSALSGIDDSGLGVEPEAYEEIERLLEKLSAPIDKSKLFQTDLFKPSTSLCLGEPILEEIKNYAELLQSIGQSREPPSLSKFREMFLNRFERAWVPLLEVLDDDSGIGFGESAPLEMSPLLEGLFLGNPSIPGGLSLQSMDLFLLKKLVQHSEKKTKELVLDKQELLMVQKPSGQLPSSFSLLFSIVAASSKAINDGNYEIYSRGGFGPSGARILGRFLDYDHDLRHAVKQHLSEEELDEPDAIYAEIVHLPEGRLGNILFRPLLRQFEITYLGRSGAPRECQIPASDLMVTVSEGGEILLFSKQLRKRIVPRLSNAHGFTNPSQSSVYRFLCTLQHQGAVGVPYFHWGVLDVLPFLPRLRVGKLIISCARWRLDDNEISKITSASRYDSFISVQELRKTRGLPRWVVLAEADNTLPIDLDNPLSVDALIHVLKRVRSASIQEMIPTPDELCVQGPEGKFFHEILVPMRLNRQEGAPEDELQVNLRRQSLKAATNLVDISERISISGATWLYLKLYGSVTSLEQVLVAAIPELLENIGVQRDAASWFFIRYADPEQHLRVRFQIDDAQMRLALFSSISDVFSKFLNQKKISKLSMDTYEREIERYGGIDGMTLAEKIFAADSQAILELLTVGGDQMDHTERWHIALLGVDCLLNDFLISIPKRTKILIRLRDNFQKEHGGMQFLKQGLANKYRSERRNIEKILAKQHGSGGVRAAYNVFDARSRRIEKPVQEIYFLEREGRLTCPVEHLIVSYLHMHINRVMRASQRHYELVIYHFLAQFYIGQGARNTHAMGSKLGTELTDTVTN
jgi:lantibiotic biosynthesis protein